MKVGIDIQTLETAEKVRGIGRYTAGLIEGLLQLDEDLELTLFGFAKRCPLGKNPKASYVRYPEHISREAWLRQGVTAPLAWSDEARELDAFLVTSPLMPDMLIPRNAPCPIGFIIYDLIPLILRNRLPNILPDEARASYETRLDVIKGDSRNGGYDFAVSISESTRRDVMAWLDLPSERIASISTGIDNRFFQSVSEGAASKVLKRLGIDAPYIFSVSGYNPRKNWAGTLKAFSALPRNLRKRHTLVLTCELDDAQRREIQGCADDLGIGARLKLTGFLADADLPALYHGAECFIFASLYEGFGIPIAEAMACGCPVVAADNSSLPEVLDGHGRLADARDAAAFAEAITQTLKNSEEAVEDASAAAERAAEYQWKNVARRFVDFVREGAAPKRQAVHAAAFVSPRMIGTPFEKDVVNRLLQAASRQFDMPIVDYKEAAGNRLIYPMAGGVDLELTLRAMQDLGGQLWLIDPQIASTIERLVGRGLNPAEWSGHTGVRLAQVPHPLLANLLSRANGIIASADILSRFCDAEMPKRELDIIPALFEGRPAPKPADNSTILILGDFDRRHHHAEILEGLTRYLHEETGMRAVFAGRVTSPQALNYLYRQKAAADCYDRIMISAPGSLDDVVDLLSRARLCVYLPGPVSISYLMKGLAFASGCPLTVFEGEDFADLPDDAVLKLDPEAPLPDQIYYTLKETGQQPQLLQHLSASAQRLRQNASIPPQLV